MGTITEMKLDTSQLERMLLYRNENIISRFTDVLAVSAEEAEDIFTETKKFLWLCQLPGIFINDDLLIIDEMWHNFILFTKDYHHFCQSHFNRYFHHLPSSKKEKEDFRKKSENHPELAKQEYKTRMRHLMGAAFDHLGEDTVKLWFQQYSEKYSRAQILSLRLK
jgi:hypothetical protein